jgi:8-oxo-dGTP pyrophosphatase MutT (NUDIX family)
MESSMSASRSTSTTAIRAAGGIILGTGKNDGKIVLVHRRRYGGEIGLPKGKLRKGEDDMTAALREVFEETGLTTRIRKYAGTTNYLVNSVPKIVTYFIMELEHANSRGPRDHGEIESIEWVTPSKAFAMLTHHEDRELINKVFDVGG